MGLQIHHRDGSGVTEQDIIDIAAVFEKYVAAKDRQSFISDLEASYF
jgi:hypothetical protein